MLEGGSSLGQTVSGSSVLPQSVHKDRERKGSAPKKKVVLWGCVSWKHSEWWCNFFPLRAVIPSTPPPNKPPNRANSGGAAQI